MTWPPVAKSFVYLIKTTLIRNFQIMSTRVGSFDVDDKPVRGTNFNEYTLVSTRVVFQFKLIDKFLLSKI